MSVKIFGMLPYLKKASLSIQCAPGNCGFQFAANGLHEERPDVTVATVNAIRIAIVSRTV